MPDPDEDLYDVNENETNTEPEDNGPSDDEIESAEIDRLADRQMEEPADGDTPHGVSDESEPVDPSAD